MSGNYPPGVSAAHPHFNPPDHSHEHEWWAERGENPIFEDGAAIFLERCEYAEGRYGDEWECEETRSMRCDVEEIIKVRDGEPNITYLVDELDCRTNFFDHFKLLFERTVIEIETKESDSLEILDLDPANNHGDGYVKVKILDYEVVYRQ